MHQGAGRAGEGRVMAEYVCEVVTERELCGDVHHYVRKKRVVRCRECAFSDYGGRRCNRFLDEFDGEPALVMPDGFCAWGEEREA